MLTVLACTNPPAGRQRWTVRLLADKFVDVAEGEAISVSTVQTWLKKTISNPGRNANGAWGD